MKAEIKTPRGFKRLKPGTPLKPEDYTFSFEWEHRRGPKWERVNDPLGCLVQRTTPAIRPTR